MYWTIVCHMECTAGHEGSIQIMPQDGRGGSLVLQGLTGYCSMPGEDSRCSSLEESALGCARWCELDFWYSRYGCACWVLRLDGGCGRRGTKKGVGRTVVVSHVTACRLGLDDWLGLC